MNLSLLACPPAGTGVHGFIYHAACCAVEAKLPEFGIRDLIREKTRGCGRKVYLSEIDSAIKNARKKVSIKGVEYKRDPSTPDAPRWSKIDISKRDLICKHGIGDYDLCDLSPSCIDRSGEEFVDGLFSGNPLLCLGLSEWKCVTRRRDTWRGHVERLSHIVPSTMTARKGINMEGKSSDRCRDNTGERLYLVLDFDTGTFDDQAAIIWFLAQRRPLKMVMGSANKSRHAWFKVLGIPEVALLVFMEEAVSLGADRSLWWKEHMARIPGGYRDDKKAKGRQTVLYFNDSI
jgi:hypothetical protein